MSNLVGNPKGQFSHDAAHVIFPGISDMTVGRLSDFKSADDEDIDSTQTVIKKKTGPKVVKF